MASASVWSSIQLCSLCWCFIFTRFGTLLTVTCPISTKVMTLLKTLVIAETLGNHCCCSVVSCVRLLPHGLQHASLPCPSPSPRILPSSCPLNQWCHPTISSSATLFSFCLQSFPAPVFSNESALCIWWPKHRSFSFSFSLSSEYSEFISLGLTGLISLLSKGLARVFSSTTVQKHYFFGTQSFLWSNSHICTWLLVKL